MPFLTFYAQQFVGKLSAYILRKNMVLEKSYQLFFDTNRKIVLHLDQVSFGFLIPLSFPSFFPPFLNMASTFPFLSSFTHISTQLIVRNWVFDLQMYCHGAYFG